MRFEGAGELRGRRLRVIESLEPRDGLRQRWVDVPIRIRAPDPQVAGHEVVPVARNAIRFRFRYRLISPHDLILWRSRYPRVF